MTARSTVYGKYTAGSGAILGNPDRVWSELADSEVIASYEKSIRGDLAKSGIAAEALASWRIMDVGTGRQALAFLRMGARDVRHFDISLENVARVRAHIEAAGLGDRMRTTCCDLVETDLGREEYDFVYLNGIAQHFSDVGRGLVNCIRALKPGGLLWLYFYRSGTFDNFILYMLRTLASGGNVVFDDALTRKHYAAARLFFSPDARDNYLTSVYMDGVFTRYARLYTAATYLNFAGMCGLEAVSSSGLDPVGCDVDHYFTRAASVVTLKKTRTVSNDSLARAARLLAPEAEVDQLDPSHYCEAEILHSIALYDDLRSALALPHVPDGVRILTVMRLFAFLAQHTRAAGYDATKRHHDLHELLENTIALLAEEYGARAGGPNP